MTTPERTTPPPGSDSPTAVPSRAASPSLAGGGVGAGGGKQYPRWHQYTLKPFAGLWKDLRARAPYYMSDYTDAWNYRVVPATALTFCANILPALAFAFELLERTEEYGVVEVLLASFMGAAAFSIFGCQPLCIVGVTGPITVLNSIIYDIIHDSGDDVNYLEVVAWVYIFSAIMHWLIAITNLSNWLRHITKFSCETFGFYVAWVYLLYGCQILARQSDRPSTTDGQMLLSAFLAVTFLATFHAFLLTSRSAFLHPLVRRFVADYGLIVAVVACSGLPYWGRFDAVSAIKLPTGKAFRPWPDRDWVVPFWNCPGKWIGIAVPFAVILTVLFYFDHQVSSIISQGSQFPLRKPPGFHWDFALLGATTFLSGIFGFPAPNGLIPQAPIHTNSLVITGRPTRKTDEESPASSEEDEKAGGGWKEDRDVPVGVVEQRVSNLAQGALALVCCTGPLLTVVGLIPTGVLAGLFWSMGLDALYGNMLTEQFLFLIRDRRLTDPNHKFHKVRRSRVWLFLLLELLGFAATYAITNTRGAIGFPLIIILLVPLRTYVVPRTKWFTTEELSILDGPAASAFTMAGLTL